MSDAKNSVAKFFQDYEKTPVVVTHNNPAELKSAIDDALRKLLSEHHGFKENFKHMDIKLTLGYTACALAAYASIYSYLVPFPDCKPVLLICVVGYFFFNTAMMMYMSMVEKHTVYVGTKKDPLGVNATQHIQIATEFNKDTGEYTMAIDIDTDPHGKSKKSKHSNIKKAWCVGKCFDVDGMFSAKAFYDLLAPLVNDNGFKMD